MLEHVLIVAGAAAFAGKCSGDCVQSEVILSSRNLSTGEVRGAEGRLGGGGFLFPILLAAKKSKNVQEAACLEKQP